MTVFLVFIFLKLKIKINHTKFIYALRHSELEVEELKHHIKEIED